MKLQRLTKNLFTLSIKLSSILFLFFSFTTSVLGQGSVEKEVLSEKFSGNVLPVGWLSTSISNYKWEVAQEANDPQVSALSITKTNTRIIDLNAWAFTSSIWMYPGVEYTISFNQRNKASGSASFKVVKSALQDLTLTTAITSRTISGKTDWSRQEIKFTVTREGIHYLGFVINRADGDLNISLDDIKVTATHEVKVFYNNSLGDFSSPAAWGTNKDGSGTQPVSFTLPYQSFHIINYPTNTSFQLANNWLVTGEGSKIVLGDGFTPVTMQLTDTKSLEAGLIDVADHATLSVDAPKVPKLGTLGRLSTIIFGKNTPAEVTEGTEFGTVIFNSGKQNKLMNKVFIKGNLDLMDAKLELGDHDLEVASGAAILNSSVNNYVVISGKGRLRQALKAGGSEVTLPVGNKSYNPVKLKLAAGSQDDVFSVGILDGMYGSYINDVPQLNSALTEKALNKTWIISEDVKGGSDITMTLSWNASDALPGFDAENCHIKHYENGTWDETVSVRATLSGTTYSVTRSGITSFSPYTVSSGETTVTPMPVELLYFAAKATPDNTVELTWATAMEKDSDYFSVERSTDGISFTQIARVNSVGTTGTRTNYSFTDKSTLSGTLYYRLRQVDVDGSFALMPVRVVTLKSAQKPVLTLYPNPAQGSNVNLRVQGLPQGEEATLLVTDMMGKNVLEQRLQSEGAVLTKNELSAGTYLVRVVSKAGSLNQKLVIR
ncbi:hypothetical protein GCM10027443_08550 [Pontibacter brevis]